MSRDLCCHAACRGRSRTCSWIDFPLFHFEEEEEDLFVFNHTIEGPRFTHALSSLLSRFYRYLSLSLSHLTHSRSSSWMRKTWGTECGRGMIKHLVWICVLTLLLTQEDPEFTSTLSPAMIWPLFNMLFNHPVLCMDTWSITYLFLDTYFLTPMCAERTHRQTHTHTHTTGFCVQSMVYMSAIENTFYI